MPPCTQKHFPETKKAVSHLECQCLVLGMSKVCLLPLQKSPLHDENQLQHPLLEQIIKSSLKGFEARALLHKVCVRSISTHYPH